MMDLKEATQNPNRHPWELSRTRNLLNMVMKYSVNKECIKIADIGAGDRYFDNQLIEELRSKNIASVIFAIDNQYGEQVSQDDEIVMLNDIQKLEKNSIDCIIMMDVLEHIEDDKSFLSLALDKLTEGGILILTVPAFQNLFSSHDIYLRHYRRYSYIGLKKLLTSNKVKIIKIHYFYTVLSIARWLQLRLTKIKPEKSNAGIGMWKYSKESFITKGVESILNIDFSMNINLNKIGILSPGLSLFAVAKKNNCNNEINKDG